MMTPSDAVVYLWQRQSVWSQTANRIKAGISRARLVTLALTIAGAVLGTAASQAIGSHPTLGRLFAAAAAVALVLVPIVGRGASRETVQDWTRARSVSEALKGEVHTYLAGVEPFGGEDRDALLLRRFEKLMGAVGDLIKHCSGISAKAREIPAVRDVASYVTVRVRGQIDDYYSPGARRMGARSTLLKRGETTLAAVAAVLAAAVGIFPSEALAAWIAVLTTLAAALAAHAAAGRYEYQQIEFARTADELERLLAWRTTTGASGDDEFVAACERIISIQNEGWMAALTTEDESRDRS
jgi:hypothetical protein